MSRSGYVDDIDDNLAAGRWRGRVMSAIRGKRGQKLLRDMRDALDAMPEKRLIPNDLRNADGEVCALGAVGVLRGIDMSKIDPEEPEQVAAAFDIAEPLAREIAYENDEELWGASKDQQPQARWKHMRRWLDQNIGSDNAKEAHDAN